MTHRNEPDPTAAEVERAKRQLRRSGLGDLADDPPELAEVRALLPRTEPSKHHYADTRPGEPGDMLGLEDQAPAPARPGRWIGRTSGPDVFIPGDREQATEIMRRYIDAGCRCQACASLDCPGAYGPVDLCPRWQEAEQRNARGEYLPTSPGMHLESWRQLAEPDTLRWSPDAYTYQAGPEVPRPYGGPLSDPWGRPWCDCGEPLELHAHIRGSVTGAWCYAPRGVLRPGELHRAEQRDRLGRALRIAALVLLGCAAGLTVLYAIAVAIVINGLSG